MTVYAKNAHQTNSILIGLYTMTKCDYTKNAWVDQHKEINEHNIFNSRMSNVEKKEGGGGGGLFQHKPKKEKIEVKVAMEVWSGGSVWSSAATSRVLLCVFCLASREAGTCQLSGISLAGQP